MNDLIDVHAHFLLKEYVAAAERAGHLRPDGMPGWPVWSAAKHLELMDRTGIAKSVLSVSSPGVHFGDDFRAQVLARRMNEAAAEVAKDHPGRFGFFASLPLPDVAGSLVELEHAYDVLGADGVILNSNAGGQYPGDPSVGAALACTGRAGRCGVSAPDVTAAVATGLAGPAAADDRVPVRQCPGGDRPGAHRDLHPLPADPLRRHPRRRSHPAAGRPARPVPGHLRSRERSAQRDRPAQGPLVRRRRYAGAEPARRPCRP